MSLNFPFVSTHKVPLYLADHGDYLLHFHSYFSLRHHSTFFHMKKFWGNLYVESTFTLITDLFKTL